MAKFAQMLDSLPASPQDGVELIQFHFAFYIYSYLFVAWSCSRYLALAIIRHQEKYFRMAISLWLYPRWNDCCSAVFLNKSSRYQKKRTHIYCSCSMVVFLRWYKIAVLYCSPGSSKMSFLFLMHLDKRVVWDVAGPCALLWPYFED